MLGVAAKPKIFRYDLVKKLKIFIFFNIFIQKKMTWSNAIALYIEICTCFLFIFTCALYNSNVYHVLLIFKLNWAYARLEPNLLFLRG